MHMAKIIESTLMTLNGVIEDPAKWVGRYLDDDFQKGALERLLRTEAMLMGRNTYGLVSRDWASQKGEFAEAINRVRKYVISSTLEQANWNNSTIVRGDVVREVSKLKEEVDGELAIYGHGLLSQTLLKNGLIDEIRVSIFPLLLGSGKLLFRQGKQRALRLIETMSLPTGVVVVRYDSTAQ
jgi:dihydrofolate reductase